MAYTAKKGQHGSLQISEDDPARSHHPQPERALVLAVIEQAVRDIGCRPKPRHRIVDPRRNREYRNLVLSQYRAHRSTALWWLLEERDPKRERAFSLDWCCSMLGYPAERVRQRVRVTLGMTRDPRIQPFNFSKGA